MFEQFPKRRIELPENYKKIYLEHYRKNRAGATPATFLSSKMEKWMHRKVAEDCLNGVTKSTLELGAGTLNHLTYERNTPYDIVEPFSELYNGLEELTKISSIYSDIAEIDTGKKYDRIISIANFEHILNLPEVVARAALLLNNSGVLRVGMPTEGGFLWKLGYTITTGAEFRLKYGLKYSVLMKHEHVSTADEIEEILKYFFEDVTCFFLGFSKNISFYRFYTCALPNKNKASKYLEAFN